MRTHRAKTDLLASIKLIEKIGKMAIEFLNSQFPENERKNGLYLTLIDRESGELTLTLKIGTMVASEWRRCLDLSISQASKLFFSLFRGHITSFESSHDSDGLPQGAIVFDRYIWSVGGQKEEANEAIAMALGIRRFYKPYRGVKRDFIKAVKGRTGNALFNPLEKHLIRAGC